MDCAARLHSWLLSDFSQGSVCWVGSTQGAVSPWDPAWLPHSHPCSSPAPGISSSLPGHHPAPSGAILHVTKKALGP